MFLHITTTKNIVLAPQHFGPRLRETLYERLRAEVEGTCTGRFGFVVMGTNIKKVGEGVIQDTSAHAKFAVVYECIVFRPFKGEVLDCIVTSVNKASGGGRRRARDGAAPSHAHSSRWVSLRRRGPCRCLCPTTCALQLRSVLRGPTHRDRPARAPAQLIPEDMKFNSVDEPCYVSDDELVRPTRCSPPALCIGGAAAARVPRLSPSKGGVALIRTEGSCRSSVP